jgi:hypothetical protein
MESVRSQSLVLAWVAFAACASAAHPAAAQARMLATPYGTIPPWTPTSVVAPPPAPDPEWQAWDPAFQVQQAERSAAPGGGRVLRMAESMVDGGTVVRGSCYDWVDAVFTRAGGRWHQTFHSSIEHGPYAQAQDFRPGDWVMFINEGFGGDTTHTHSAIFVGWVDEAQRTAMMVSYPGGRRDEPGRYSTYDLTHAYRIQRMEDEAPPPPAPRRSARAGRHAAHRAGHH